MAVTVPPVPYKVKVLNPAGFLSDPWAKWFRELFSRIGGTQALSNTELADAQSVGVEDLSLTVASSSSAISNLQSLATTHTGEITDIYIDLDGLNQGPVL